MNSVTYQEALKWASLHIADQQIDPSAPQFILLARHHWSLTTYLIHQRDVMPPAEWVSFQADIERLLKFEPAQYIVGAAPFLGREFIVNHDVLIPESETEELVEWVLQTFNQAPIRVLDLGTGSGVIGITLKLERPNWEVVASDISSTALAVAQQNAQNLQADVTYVQSDLFEHLNEQRFDVIVTNPPYISQSERDVMDRSVLEYEPEIALFADQNGLGFYERLFQELPNHLTPDGQLFGEVGYAQRQPIIELFKKHFANATIQTRNDLSDNMRMIRGFEFKKGDM